VQGTAKFGGGKHISFTKGDEHFTDDDYYEIPQQ
jgi:hypothetical protein